MYPLGHVGIAVGAAYGLSVGLARLGAFRGGAAARLAEAVRGADYRLIALGAVLPDLVDKGLYGLLGAPLSKGPGHTLGLSLALLAAAVALRVAGARGGGAAASLGVGALSHQLLDRPWLWATVFLQPAPAARQWVAWDPAASAAGYAHPWTLTGELLGLALLAWVAWRARLWRPRARRALVRDGRLRGDG